MKNWKVCVALALQVLVIGILTISLFGEKTSVEVDASFFQGVGEYRESEWYIDGNYGAQDAFLTSQEISVPAGVYRVQLLYETNTEMVNYCSVSDPYAAHAQVLSNGEHLYSGLRQTDYDVWIWDGNGSLTIQVSYGGSGSLAVQGARIYDTGAMQRMFLFAAIVLFLMADAAWIYLQCKAKEGISAQQKIVGLSLALIILYSSVPLLTNYLRGGGDLIFHLLRIEGVKDGLLSGQFPVRIAPEWLRGHGYAASVFYGDTMLYIPALLRIVGFDVQTSYKLLILLINAGTCILSYLAFLKIFKHKAIGVLCSMLYTMSIYRMHMAYVSARLGELLGIMFVPLIVVGLYQIFSEDIKEKKYKWNWVLPTIGFCGIIQSHILSTYMVGMFVLLVCVILWKKVLRKETFLQLAAIVIFSAVICAWFIVPFLDYMSEGAFVINNVSGREIQFRGLQIAQLFKIFYFAGDTIFFYEGGMIDAEPLGIGGALLVGLPLYFVLSWLGYMEKLNGKLVKLGKLACFVGMLAMVMSTQAFPWDRIQRINGLTASLVSSLEFPTRFLNIVTIMLVLVIGVVGVCILNLDNSAWKIGFMTVVMGLFLVGNVLVINDISNTGGILRLYNEESMGTGYVSGEEYLYVGTKVSDLWYRDADSGDHITVTEYEKDALSAKFTCINSSEDESYVELPILYYKGYRAETEEGEQLQVGLGENNVLRVMIPGGYRGEISVGFVSPWYWRVAEVVSVVFVIGFVVVYCLSKRKEKVLCAN